MGGKIFEYTNNCPAVYALTAAVLFGLNAPLSKLLLADIPPLFMAAFLYIGAGLGMAILQMAKMEKKKLRCQKKKFPGQRE